MEDLPKEIVDEILSNLPISEIYSLKNINGMFVPIFNRTLLERSNTYEPYLLAIENDDLAVFSVLLHHHNGVFGSVNLNEMISLAFSTLTLEISKYILSTIPFDDYNLTINYRTLGRLASDPYIRALLIRNDIITDEFDPVGFMGSFNTIHDETMNGSNEFYEDQTEQGDGRSQYIYEEENEEETGDQYIYVENPMRNHDNVRDPYIYDQDDPSTTQSLGMSMRGAENLDLDEGKFKLGLGGMDDADGSFVYDKHMKDLGNMSMENDGYSRKFTAKMDYSERFSSVRNYREYLKYLEDPSMVDSYADQANEVIDFIEVVVGVNGFYTGNYLILIDGDPNFRHNKGDEYCRRDVLNLDLYDDFHYSSLYVERLMIHNSNIFPDRQSVRDVVLYIFIFRPKYIKELTVDDMDAIINLPLDEHDIRLVEDCAKIGGL